MAKEVPPSVDAVELVVGEDGKVHAWCLLCMEDIGQPYVLANAISMWEKHQAKFQGKDKAS